MKAFGRPDCFLQPAHQRQVVGESAHDGHGCVAVQIDEAGGDDVLGQSDCFCRHVKGSGLGNRENRDNASAADGDGVMFERRVVWLDGDDPARFYQQVDRYCHGGSRQCQ